MYETHWQLNQKPFQPVADLQFYYPSESHQAALLKLRYVLENRQGAGLLAGAAGVGKSLLVHLLRATLPEVYRPFVHVRYPLFPPAELMACLSRELTGQPTSRSTSENVAAIQTFLDQNHGQGRHAVVAIDDAHLLDNEEVWESLRLLLNFEVAGQATLTLLLVGQTGLLSLIDRLPSLNDRLALKCLLRPFSNDETAAYVAHRLKIAGTTRSIFSSDAIDRVQELAQGVPRRVNRLCDLSLLVGYAEGQNEVGAALVESVCQELIELVPP